MRWLPVEIRDEVEGELMSRYRVLREIRGRTIAGAWAWRQPIVALTARLRWGRAVVPRDRTRGAFIALIPYHFVHAVRLLIRDRAFTLGATLALAMGVGANVAVFAVVDAVLLRPLPYPEADRLVVLQHRDLPTGRTKEFVAIGDYVDIVARQASFESVGAYEMDAGTVTGLGEPFRASVLLATDGALTALRMQPVLGRSLQLTDTRPNAAPVVILGYEFWLHRFGSDAHVLGRHLKVGPIDAEIVGVAPPQFRFPPETPSDFIMPRPVPVSTPADRKSDWTFAVGRLKPGVSITAAGQDLAAISIRMANEHPAENEGSRYAPLTLRDKLVGSSRVALELLLAVVALVLVISCANVTNLLLARSIGRQREMALRLALGAEMRHLVAQLLAKSVVLVVAATSVGVALALWAARGLVAMVPTSITVRGLQDVHLNLTVAVVAAAIAIGTVLGFAIVSAVTVRAQSPVGALAATRTTAGPRARYVRSSLVMVELAMGVALLIGAGLVLRSLVRLTDVNPGFGVDHVLTFHASVPTERYPTPEARQAFYARAVSAVRATPGVRQVGQAAVVPLTGNNFTAPFERADDRTPDGNRPPDVGWQVASAGYFAALEIPLISGRVFSDRDSPTSPPVVVVSQSIERKFFPGGSAIGHRILATNDRTAEIVGVVGDIRRGSLGDGPRADLYYATEQQPAAEENWFIRTAGDPAQALPAVQAALQAIEPAITLTQRRTMADIASQSTAALRFTTWLLGAFAVLALVLAATGVYSVMSYATRQRTREIAVRTALGATRSDVLRLVMRQGAVLAACGLSVGLLAGAVLVRATPLRSLLFNTSMADPLTWTLAPAALFFCALAACYVPAVRSARIDPVRALSE